MFFPMIPQTCNDKAKGAPSSLAPSMPVILGWRPPGLLRLAALTTKPVQWHSTAQTPCPPRAVPALANPWEGFWGGSFMGDWPCCGHSEASSAASTQLPLQLMQSCLVSALRVETEKQPQRIFYKDKSKVSPYSLSWDVFVCLFSFFKFTQKRKRMVIISFSPSQLLEMFTEAKTYLDVCQLLNRSCFSCQIYPLFFSAYK